MAPENGSAGFQPGFDENSKRGMPARGRRYNCDADRFMKNQRHGCHDLLRALQPHIRARPCVLLLALCSSMLSPLLAKQNETPVTQILTSPPETFITAGQLFRLPGFHSQINARPVPEEIGPETGLRSAWLRGFILKSLQSLHDNHDSIRADIFEMLDPPGAYGLYTLASTTLHEEVSVANGGRASENVLAFWKGNYFFLLRGAPSRSLQKLAQELASQVSYAGEVPPIVDLLPRKNLEPSSIQFYVKDLLPSDGALADLRPLLSLDKSVQAAIGLYRPNGKRVIVLGYPNPALAYQAFERVEGYVRDKSHGVYAKRAGLLLGLTEGMPEDQARALLEEIRYTPKVKWIVDKQEPNKLLGRGVPFLLNTVVSSLAFSFLFILGTATVGVAFGVFRFYLHRVRPDNFFDRPERVGMIRLRIVDK
jgi:hypothetical protein